MKVYVNEDEQCSCECCRHGDVLYEDEVDEGAEQPEEDVCVSGLLKGVHATLKVLEGGVHATLQHLVAAHRGHPPQKRGPQTARSQVHLWTA